MNLRIMTATVAIFFLLQASAQQVDVDKQLQYCHQQVKKALQTLKPWDFTMEPRNILKGQSTWNCRKACAEEWCSGFWPGVLWMDYEITKDKEVFHAAEGYTQSLSFLGESPVYDHDLGFLVINSFLKGYEQTGNEDYRRIALAAADEITKLCNPKTGTMLSWPRHVKDYGGHNTIMDNIINLELLFWAADHGGSPLLRHLAIQHATTTMRHHFRPDGSVYHVAVYDTLTGQFLRGQNHQGYADYSMWSRGQSWAIYGYTMVYRYTKDLIFLNQARKAADCYLKRLHETSDDMIPIWDMDDPRGITAPKDASAACIVASALLELSTFLDGWQAVSYRDIAIRILSDLSSSRYLSGKLNVAFLKHSTGHQPNNSEVDASIIYADYYYIEALLRLKKIGRF